jgi:hypothetical protein
LLGALRLPALISGAVGSRAAESTPNISDPARRLTANETPGSVRTSKRVDGYLTDIAPRCKFLQRRRVPAVVLVELLNALAKGGKLLA